MQSTEQNGLRTWKSAHIVSNELNLSICVSIEYTRPLHNSASLILGHFFINNIFLDTVIHAWHTIIECFTFENEAGKERTYHDLLWNIEFIVK